MSRTRWAYRDLRWTMFSTAMFSTAMLAAGLVALGGCAGDGETVGAASSALAPAGSNAALVSDTIPTTMAPGERLPVQVVMQNTGTGGASNTWTTSAPVYSLLRKTSPSFGWDRRDVNTTVPVGSNHTFNFVLTAPTAPGTYTFSIRMAALGQGDFGPTITRSITVDAARQRAWDCTFVAGSSVIPASLAPGESRSLTVAVQNTGTETWAASGFSLYSRDTPLGLWNNTTRTLTSVVAPGGTASFNLTVTAPTTPGTYQFRREMFDSRATGVGFFDTVSPCVNATITVTSGTPPFDAQVVSTTLPAEMFPGESRLATVTMRNTGTQSWPADNTIYLYSANSPANLYARLIAYPATVTAVGAEQTFSFAITAPATPGSYTQAWRMRNSTGFFGQATAVPLTVSSSVARALDAVVVSQTIPTLITTGNTATFSITTRNTGAETWTGSQFMIYSRNTPFNLWGPFARQLGASESVAPGAERTFTFTVTAPTTPGTYESRWQMHQSPVAFFGEEAVTPNVVVTSCGNSTVDVGEACDDGNLTNGDGCSSACAFELEDFDLAVDAVDRSIRAPSTNRQLATVRIGDVTGDSVPEVIVAQNDSFTPTGGSGRNSCGAVYAFTGGAAFLDGSTSTLPTGATLQIFGASASDQLGFLNNGGVVIADVTGDGTSDLIVSAAFADGEMDARADAGEVYVLTGGSGLTGQIDLGATTAPAALRGRIIGAAAGDRLVVIGAGDFTSDGIADLVLGAPFSDTANGADSGSVYIVPGGTGLTGTIDLASATVTRILGPAADARLGSIAAVGDVAGTTDVDLFLGNRNYAMPGRTRTGAVWGFIGPLTSNRDLASAVGSASGASVAWIGETQNDNFGSSLALGNVVGTSANDLVVGSIQHRRSGTQVGAVIVWDGASVALGTTSDLGAGAVPTALFRGATANDNTGASVAVGDVNGDGRADIAFGSGLANNGPAAARADAGEAAVYFGAATLPALTDLSTVPGRIRVYGAAASDATGGHASGLALADINGDGRADLCVGGFQGGSARGGRIDCIASMF
jgi:cysteine-rich repeat protein